MIDLQGNQRSLPTDPEAQLVQDVINEIDNPLDAVMLLTEKRAFIDKCIDEIRPAAAQYAKTKLRELANMEGAPQSFKGLADIIESISNLIDDIEQEEKLSNLGLSDNGIKNN